MTVAESDITLVAMNHTGEKAEFLAQCDTPDIVGIEGEGSEALPGRRERIGAVLRRHR